MEPAKFNNKLRRHKSKYAYHLFLKTIHQSVRKAIEILKAVSKGSVQLITPTVCIKTKMPL